MSRSTRRAPIRPAAARPAGFFVLRTPLLPVDAWTALTAPSALTGRAGSDAVEPGDRLDDRRRALRARLGELIAQPAVQEAIFVASAGLAAAAPIWARDPESRRGQQIERALYRIVARMAGQPAPVGLLAGTSIAAIAETTELVLADRTADRRHSRLDLGFVAALAERLADRVELRDQLVYRVNPSIYRAAGKVHVVAAQREAPARGFRLIAADATPHLDATLARAAHGARLAELAEALLRDDAEIGVDDARGFVHQLVDAQFLVAPLAPPLTGDDPVAAFVAELRGYRGVDDVARPLAEAHRALAALDRAPLGSSLDAHRAVIRALDGLAVRAAPACRVELHKASPGATLGRRVVAEVLRGVEIVRQLAERPSTLRSFVEAFAMRYGDAEVPLLEALDADTGIGFGASPGATVAAPLLDGLAFPGSAPAARFAPRDAWLLRRIEDARRAGDTVVELSPDDLARVSEREPVPLPPSLAAVVRIAARSHEALAGGDFHVIIERVSGLSGAAELAGLAAGDPAVMAHVADHLRAEQAIDPGAVLAEIVHLPATGEAHRAVRPILRSHEIVYLGRSGAPDAAQIPASDLMISIGRDEQIVLRSRRLDRVIVPRLTAPHRDVDPGGPAVYRLLCALAAQGTAAELRFAWGPLEALSFLPRVRVGRVVLARARWRLFADQLEEILAPGGARFAAMQRLRDPLALPDRVELDAGDHGVFLDLDNPLCVDILAAQARRRGDVRLFEIYPALDELCAAGPDGRFVSELVIPFVRDAAPPPRTEPPAPRRSGVGHFVPGTEWLQVNLYTARGTTDAVLRDLVAPQMVRGVSDASIDRWFFVRYSQPDWHVRLHIHGDPATLQSSVLPALHTPAAEQLADGRLWKLQLDSYRREVERYGGPDGIELAEAMFHADSEAVVGLLDLLEGDAGEQARWRLCLLGIHMLLGDLGLSLADRCAVMRRARDGVARSVGVDRRFERQLAARYRRARAGLEALVDPLFDPQFDPAGAAGELAPAIAVLHERSQKLAPSLRQLAACAADGRLSRPVDELARSHVHMFANRLLRSAALAQELVLYDWLRRLYESRLARRST